MPKFKGYEIFDITEQVGKITDKIESALQEEKPGKEIISVMSVLYKKRKNLLLVLEEWLKSKNGQEYVSKNTDVWAGKIGPVIEKDKKNVKAIEEKVDSLNKELRNLIKNKSLLIYSERRK